MSYAAIAALVSGKRPVWLYRITLGDEEARYTSRNTDFTETDFDMFEALDIFASEDLFTRVWSKRAISHTRFRQTASTARAETKLVLPNSDPFARLFLEDGGLRESSVTIWHGYTNDPDGEFVVKFRGRVVDTRPFLGTITLACENRFTSMRRKGLAAVMQRPCRHALYHTGCGLSIADFEVAATASAFAVPVLTVAEAASQPDGYYSGGVVTYGNRRQMITAHSGTQLVLLAPVLGLAQAIADDGSAPVRIAPGCNLSMQTCQDKFDNLLNHGGFPPDQSVNAYLAARYSGLISAHRGAVSVIANQIEIGESPQLKPIAFKARNVFSTYQNWLPARAPINGEAEFGAAAIYIALDDSGSMSGPRFTNQQAAITGFIESLKGSVNSVKIVYWSTGVGATIERFNCTTADYDEILDFIAAKGPPAFGTNFDDGVSLAAQFFADDAATRPDSLFLTGFLGLLDQLTEQTQTETRRKVVLFLTDGSPSTISGVNTAITAAERLATIQDVEVFCFNIEFPDTTWTELLDNTPQDGVPVISGGDPEAIQLALANAFATWTDINPAHILRDLILSPTSGGSGNAAEIGDSFTAAANLLFNEGFGLSLLQANPSSAEEFKRLIETHIDAAVYFDRITGKWEIKLIRDDYDAAALYTFDGSNITEWLDASLPSQFDLPNKITVTYTKREDGKKSALTRTNVAAVQALGRIIPDTVTYEGITSDRLAAQVAQRDLLARTVPLHLGSFRATYVPTELNLGSAIIVNEPRMGINSVICRITEIEDGDGRDNSVIIRYVEDKFALPEIVIEEPDEIDAPLTGEALPPSVTFVEEEGYFFAAQRSGQAILDIELGADPGLGRFFATTDRPNDQHIDITIARLDGGAFVDVGLAGFAGAGPLLDTLSAAADATTFTIPDSADLQDVQVGSLLRVGQEYMRVDALTVDAGIATVTVGRGCLDTVPARHEAGAIAIFFAGETGSDDLAYSDGDSLDIKLLPATSSDIAATDAVVTDTVTFASRAIRPYPVGQFRIDGSYSPVGVMPSPTSLTWVHRDRTSQIDPAVLAHDEPGVGPETDVAYTVHAASVVVRANLFAPADFFAVHELFFAPDPVRFFSEPVAQDLSYSYTQAEIDLFDYPDFFAIEDLFEGLLDPRAWAIEFSVEASRGDYTNWQTPKLRAVPLLAPINLFAEGFEAEAPPPPPDPVTMNVSAVKIGAVVRATTIDISAVKIGAVVREIP